MFAIVILTLLAIVAVVAVVVVTKSPANSDAQGGGVVVAGGATALFLLMLALTGHTFIDNQHVGYTKVFGVVQTDSHIEPGFHLKAPWKSVDQVDTAVKTMNFSGTQGANPLLEGLTSDQVLLHVDVAVTWTPVASNVPLFKNRFGTDANYDEQVYSIIRSAVRDVLASTAWKDGAIQNRAAFAEHIKHAIEAKTVVFFTEAGLDPVAAKSMVRYGAVNLRQIKPPEEIQQVNNDMAAADQKEALQEKLRRVEASARQMNAERAKNLTTLVAVPEGMSPREYADILHAMNERMNAETTRDAIIGGKQNVTVVVGMGVAPTPTTGIK